jgi:hypothetical protein
MHMIPSCQCSPQMQLERQVGKMCCRNPGWSHVERTVCDILKSMLVSRLVEIDFLVKQ